MELQNIYNINQDSILFEESSFFKKTKKKLIDNYRLNPKIIRNNESIKFIDKKIIRDLQYKFDKNKQQILIDKNLNNPFTSIFLKNGHLQKIENINEKKFQIKSLENEPRLAEKKFLKYQDLFEDDYIINLNSIFLNTCYDFDFSKNISQKVYLSHNIDNSGNTNYTRNFININENSKIVFIEDFSNQLKSNQNIINFFEVQKNSELVHLVIQNNSIDSSLQFTTHANCYENSTYKQIIFNTSASSSRNHHYVNLLEKNAFTNLNGVFFGSSDQIIDNKTQANHFAENCISEQKYKGIMRDNSKGNYMSKTYVDKIAQKTEAYQLSKGIILSENAFFHSKPELKIFADDVKCSHGSTIGSFDDNILFYMKSRGLSENLAISLLIKSFFAEMLTEQTDITFRNLVNESVEGWLQNNRYVDVG